MVEPAREWHLLSPRWRAPGTKFVRPELADNVVLDEDLLAGLRRSITEVATTLISAQAGAGKTTLASAAVGAGSPLPAAWVSLDDGDDEPAAFLGLIGEAISTLLPDGCPAFLEVLNAGFDTGGGQRRAVGVLINDLLAAGPPPFVLVLDDLHVLQDGAVLSALDYLLAHAPPHLHVLLTSRVDPPLSFSRLRTAGRLAEVRGDDLRLGVEQADTLLNRHLGMALPPDEVAGVVDAVGGWAAGVRLLGRSLHRGDVLLAPRPSDGDRAAVYDYLADEVLSDESDECRQFLFDTCVLLELDPRACAALAGREDAGAVLADLHRRLHFLVLALDADAGQYRYHDLFAEFLRRRLAATEPGRLSAQHRRAAAVVPETPRRIEHLLAAGDDEQAADLIETTGRGVLGKPGALQRVSAWIDRLSPEVVAAQPWLRLLAGVAAMDRGDMSATVELLEPLLESMQADDDYLGQWLVLRYLHQATNDHAGLLPRIAALAARPEFAQLQPAIQIDHHAGVTYGAIYTMRWDDAAIHLAQAIDLAITSDDPVAAEILALHISPFFGVVDGGLALIEAYHERVDQRAPPGPSFIRLGVFHQRAITSWFCGRFTDAARAATAGSSLLDRLGGGRAYLRATFDWVAATTWFAAGEFHRAEQQLARRLCARPASDLDRGIEPLLAPTRARVLRAQGRGHEIPAVLLDLRAGLRLVPTPELGELLVLSVRAQEAWASGSLDAAADALCSALELEDRVRFVPGAGSPRVELAELLHEMGDHDGSRRHLTIALRTNEARGTPGIVAQAGAALIPLLEDARRHGIAGPAASAALAALGARTAPSPIEVPGSREVLSSREVEVLRLLVAGASNRGIADALVVSEHTVKTHVRHILAKLAVRSRAEAAARARDQHLV